MTAKSIGLVSALLVFSGPVFAQEVAATVSDTALPGAASTAATVGQAGREFRSVDEEIQAIRNEVLDLNADLFRLEEALLYPANSQVAFFVSMDVGEYFGLESVSIEIDGTKVASHLYTQREVDSLIRGGVQRIHVENLNVGTHELVAVLTGEGHQLKNYRRNVEVDFAKGIGAKYLELEITDRVARQQPEFVIREWE